MVEPWMVEPSMEYHPMVESEIAVEAPKIAVEGPEIAVEAPKIGVNAPEMPAPAAGEFIPRRTLGICEAQFQWGYDLASSWDLIRPPWSCLLPAPVGYPSRGAPPNGRRDRTASCPRGWAG